MGKFVAVALAAAIIGGLPCQPVFDCTDQAVRQKYPAMCPQLSDPLLTGSGRGHGGGGGGLLSGLLHALGL